MEISSAISKYSTPDAYPNVSKHIQTYPNVSQSIKMYQKKTSIQQKQEKKHTSSETYPNVSEDIQNKDVSKHITWKVIKMMQ